MFGENNTQKLVMYGIKKLLDERPYEGMILICLIVGLLNDEITRMIYSDMVFSCIGQENAEFFSSYLSRDEIPPYDEFLDKVKLFRKDNK